jgi:hypothetical protein
LLLFLGLPSFALFVFVLVDVEDGCPVQIGRNVVVGEEGGGEGKGV